MAKSSGGTGRAAPVSRGQQLRDKYGSVEAAVNRRFPDRFRDGAAPPRALNRAIASAGVRAAVQSGRRSAADISAAERAVARRAAPRGGDAATRAGAQASRRRAARNEMAAFDRAISGRGNQRRARPGRVSPRRAARMGLPRNINF